VKKKINTIGKTTIRKNPRIHNTCPWINNHHFFPACRVSAIFIYYSYAYPYNPAGTPTTILL
jgi:hypothetical protein